MQHPMRLKLKHSLYPYLTVLLLWMPFSKPLQQVLSVMPYEAFQSINHPVAGYENSIVYHFQSICWVHLCASMWRVCFLKTCYRCYCILDISKVFDKACVRKNSRSVHNMYLKGMAAGLLGTVPLLWIENLLLFQTCCFSPVSWRNLVAISMLKSFSLHWLDASS